MNSQTHFKIATLKFREMEDNIKNFSKELETVGKN